MKYLLPSLLLALLSAGSIAHAQTQLPPNTPTAGVSAPTTPNTPLKDTGRVVQREKKELTPEQKKMLLEKRQAHKEQMEAQSVERNEIMRLRREEWKNATLEQRAALKAKYKAQKEAEANK